MIVTVLKLGVTVTTLAKTGTSQCILRKTQENDSLGSRRRTSVLYDDNLGPPDKIFGTLCGNQVIIGEWSHAISDQQ